MTKILLRRNNNAELTGVVLSSGEPAFALDLNVLKIGDGITAWENLDPIGDSGSVSAAAVSSLNGLTGGINILGGTDLEVTAAGSSITIDYTGVGGGGGVVTETDPVFTGSPAYNITNTDISNWNSAYNADVVVSGDNISLLTNDAGYLDAHPTISAASSSNSNTGNTFIQNITLDENGHITALTTAIATSGGGGGSGITEEVNDLTTAVTWTTVPDAYISQSSVIQHTGALTITESQIVDLQSYATVSSVSGFISEGDNVGLLDGNVMFDYTYGGGDVTTLNPSTSTDKINILRINPAGDTTIQGILPPTGVSSKLYDRFTLINITSNVVNLEHNSSNASSNNRIFLDSSLANNDKTILRRGESVELYYVAGTFDGGGTYRWLAHLNQNELNGDVVAGTGISLVYSTGTNELEISTSLYSVPDGITGASGVNNIVVIGSGDYDALATKNPTTLYFIT